MNPILKGTIAFGSVVGAGGLSYGVYNAMQPTPTVTPEKQKTTTYADAFQGTLLTATGDTHQVQWTARLTSLQEVKKDTDLVESLRGLKEKNSNNTWTKLRDWCAENINNSNKGEKELEFQNIQSYCTFSVKEQLGGKIIFDSTPDAVGKWKLAHGKLSKINNLNDALTTAKNTKDGSESTKVKEWCESVYSKPYKGETDPDFAIAKQVCVSD